MVLTLSLSGTISRSKRIITEYHFHIKPKIEKQKPSLTDHLFISLTCRPNTPESLVKEVNHNRVMPTSPKQNLLVLEKPQEDALNSLQVRTLAESLQEPVLDNKSKDYTEVTVKVNGTHEGNVNGEEKSKQKKKHRVCCFHFT